MSDAVALLLVIVVLTVPYLLVLVAATGRLRPIDAALAPAASVALLAWTGVVLGLLHVGYRPLSVVTVVGALALVALGVRAAVRRRVGLTGALIVPPWRLVPRRSRRLVPAAALGIGSSVVVGLTTWASSVQWISGVPGSPDDVWHGYLASYIERTGIASPWQLAPLDPVSGTPLDGYPYGLHLVAGLVAAGPTVAQTLNAALVVGAVVVSALGVAALAREAVGADRVAVAVAPVVLSLVSTWQIRLEGIPAYALGMALVPGVAAAIVRAWRLGWPVWPSVGVSLGLTGLVVVQPASVFSLLLVLLPFVVAELIRRPPDGRRLRAARPLRLLTVAAATVGLAAPWLVLAAGKGQSTLSTMRPVRTDVVDALLRTVLLDEPFAGVPLVLGVATLAGVVLALLGGITRWLAASWVLSVAVYSVAAGASEEVRRAVAGVWFADWFRIASVTALVSSLLVAGAASWLVGRATARPWLRTAATTAVAAALVVAGAQALPYYRDLTRVLTSSSSVTPSDEAAYRWVASHARPGERVLNDWADGSTWGYSLYGMPVAVPYTNTLTLVPGRAYLMAHLDELGRNDVVDAQVRALRARWVVVGEGRFPFAVKSVPVKLPPGSMYLKQVFRSGTTEVYEIDLASLPG